MLAPEEPVFVRHFLLDERLRANQAFVQQKKCRTNMGAKRSNIVGSTNIVQQRWNV